MWHHTVAAHNSVIGPNRGERDYRMVITGHFRSNLARLTNKGSRQSIMETYQANNVL